MKDSEVSRREALALAGSAVTAVVLPIGLTETGAPAKAMSQDFAKRSLQALSAFCRFNDVSRACDANKATQASTSALPTVERTEQAQRADPVRNRMNARQNALDRIEAVAFTETSTPAEAELQVSFRRMYAQVLGK